MKKFLLMVLSMCSMFAMGQVSDFGHLNHQKDVKLKSDQLKGHTPEAYMLMRYHANNTTYRVYQNKSNVASDKAEVILEAHKVFGEFAKIGFQMLLDADANTYGELFYDWSGGYYGTYDDFEYKIPENADPSESSENIVYDEAIAIEVPVGTYDFMILYPFPGDGLVFPRGEYAKFDDFEFKGGNMNNICTAPIYKLNQLNNIFIEMTAKNCNHKCKNCYIDFGFNKAPKDFISIDKIKEMLIDTSNENINCIYLTGAEPMLHPDFNSILRLCLKRCNVCICTNGSFLNEKKIRFLNKVESEGNNEIIIALSLCHYKEQENVKCKGTKIIRESENVYELIL